MSDHDIVTFNIDQKAKFQIKKPHKVYKFHKATPETIRLKVRLLSDAFFQRQPLLRSVNDNWQFIKSGLLNILETCVPSKMSKQRPHLPWISQEIKRAMRKRDRLYKTAKRSNDPAKWERFREFRNLLTNKIRQQHTDYIKDIVGKSLESENTKPFWNYIRQARTENLGVPIIKTNSKICTSDFDKSEAINQQFKSAFTTESFPLPSLPPSPYLCIQELIVNPLGVAKQLKSLKTNKATGPDEIPAKLLQLAADELSLMLTCLFQQSLDTGTIPSDWSTALVTPIYKKGLKSDPSNYRPVSLTSITCKILEHIVLSHMAKHLDYNRILSPLNHGFRAGLSCETQLITAINDWSNCLNNRSQIDLITLDFSKAFDKVPHQRLLSKLAFYGIRSNILNWISAFLSNRSQSVTVNGTHSNKIAVTSGVPQGTVLGPALFLIYINDIANNIKSSMRLFADDSILYREIKTEKDRDILQKDLIQLDKWAASWQMSFNVSKCTAMTITNKTKPLQSTYYMNNIPLSIVTSQEYLGITITSNLKWSDHINKIAKASSSKLGLLRRTLHACSKDVKETAYKALVRPKLEYASCAWNPYLIKDINRLENIQRQAARFVFSDYRRTSSPSQMMSSLGWESLETRRLITQTTMFYKILNGYVSLSLPDEIKQYHHNRSLRHLNNSYYTCPKSNLDTHLFSFYPRTIRTWNELPPSIINSSSLESFKFKCSKHFAAKASHI
jgi:hypothetical protein